jgi:hypothetical protein
VCPRPPARAANSVTLARHSPPRPLRAPQQPRITPASRRPGHVGDVRDHQLDPAQPRRVRLRRNAVQNGSASEGPVAMPSTSRRPLPLAPRHPSASAAARRSRSSPAADPCRNTSQAAPPVPSSHRSSFSLWFIEASQLQPYRKNRWPPQGGATNQNFYTTLGTRSLIESRSAAATETCVRVRQRGPFVSRATLLQRSLVGRSRRGAECPLDRAMTCRSAM